MPSPGHFEIPRARQHDRSRSRRFVVPCGIAALTVALASACGGARAANAGGVGVLAEGKYLQSRPDADSTPVGIWGSTCTTSSL
jgi:hypothetical protein